MKKLLLTLSVLCGMFLILNFDDVEANSIDVVGESVENNNVNEVLNAPNQAWRWYYRTLPINYEGQTKYLRTIKVSHLGQRTCYDGYLGATNVGGGKFVYEGYLYICGTTRPIPTKVPNPELDVYSEELTSSYREEKSVA